MLKTIHWRFFKALESLLSCLAIIKFGIDLWKVQRLVYGESESEVTQSCPTLCDSMDRSLSGSFVHVIFQLRVLEWAAISFSGDLPNPGIEPGFPALQRDALSSKPPGKPLVHSRYSNNRWYIAIVIYNTILDKNVSMGKGYVKCSFLFALSLSLW